MIRPHCLLEAFPHVFLTTFAMRSQEAGLEQKGTETAYFPIGFNKTTTRSIHHLFPENGYPSVHWDDGKLVLRMMRNMLSGKKFRRGMTESTKFIPI
ncbi:MAG: hypothetical protein WBV71_17885 [Roseobacter sp.]